MSKLPRWMLSLDHKEYLKSAIWQQVRQPIVDRAAGKCERCGNPRKRLQVHHLTYARTGGKELPQDLEAICGRCHRKAHGLNRKGEKVPRKRRARRPGVIRFTLEERRRRKAERKAAKRAGLPRPRQPRPQKSPDYYERLDALRKEKGL